MVPRDHRWLTLWERGTAIGEYIARPIICEGLPSPAAHPPALHSLASHREKAPFAQLFC